MYILFFHVILVDRIRRLASTVAGFASLAAVVKSCTLAALVALNEVSLLLVRRQVVLLTGAAFAIEHVHCGPISVD